HAHQRRGHIGYVEWLAGIAIVNEDAANGVRVNDDAEVQSILTEAQGHRGDGGENRDRRQSERYSRFPYSSYPSSIRTSQVPSAWRSVVASYESRHHCLGDPL